MEDNPTIWTVAVGDDIITIGDDLAFHLAIACDPATGGVCPPQNSDAPKTSVMLWAAELIDADGTPTDYGLRVNAAVERAMSDFMDAMIARHEAAELDDLDRACRRRPHFSRYDG